LEHKSMYQKWKITSTPHVDMEEQKRQLRSEFLGDLMSYPVFMPKPSTHRMHDLGSTVPHIRPKVFTDNQMS
jgi:hypothetical protein